MARERFVARTGGSYLVKADISHFYPALYTHAVGWAVDPKLRQKANWKNNRLLGKKLDQVLMDLQGKVSQGIPIGNDVSYLLAEIVLAAVDRKLGVERGRAYQALLAEPGVAQKAFALLGFWHLNGSQVDTEITTRAIASLMKKHVASGVCSDVSWALSFALGHKLQLDKTTGQILSHGDDDCIALQALHCNAEGLLPKGFDSKTTRAFAGPAGFAPRPQERWLRSTIRDSVRCSGLGRATR